MTTEQERLPAPDDPRPRTRKLTVVLSSGEAVQASDDSYSDRIRCDHPGTDDGEALGRALRDAAQVRRRSRVVILAPVGLREGLEAARFVHEATMPGFYAGEGDCAVMGHALDHGRHLPADAAAAEEVLRLVAQKGPGGKHPRVDTTRAVAADAEPLARLLADTFEHYPTPSGVPAYLEGQIREGTPFRLVREGDEVIACASADLVRRARTAELTDCATRPAARGRGLMQSILLDLMDDLRGMSYPTAFTLARARNPGVNLAFSRLGFEYRGRMNRSCRIGSGMEDMNVWSRRL